MRPNSSIQLRLFLLVIGSLAGFNVYYSLLTDWIDTIQGSGLTDEPTGLLTKTGCLLLYTSLAILFGIKKIPLTRRP